MSPQDAALTSSRMRGTRGTALASIIAALALSACGGSSDSGAPQTYTLSATVGGLSSSGLVLAVNSSTVSVPANATSQQLATALPSGTTYTVSVMAQPAGQSCSVTGGSGTIESANVTSVTVTCTEERYALGGSITGLSAGGLVLANGNDTLAVSSGATSFSMPAPVAYNSAYSVTVQKQPTDLTCSVSNGSGTMGAAPVTNVTVACAKDTYTIGGTVTGLTSSGLVLSDNGTGATTIAASATQFTMSTRETTGSTYTITIQTQPTGETCSVAGGTGTINMANVANVVVTCSKQAYALGGSISHLNGSGLVLANDSDTLAVKSGAKSFTMPTPVAYSSSYVVTVQMQPAGEACAVSNGTGTMPAGAVTNVAVSCSDQPFTLGGTITGLGNNAGLVLTNGPDVLDVAAGSTSFTMPTPVNFGSHYSVAVQSAPAGLTCTPGRASGSMPAHDVTNVRIACSDQSYTVSGTISGLTTSGLVLANGDDTLSVASGASSFQMHQRVAYTSTYDVTVQTQPMGLTCSISNGSGTMGTAPVTNVAVTCSTNTYTVGGKITGLTTSGLVLLDNGGDPTTISANATEFTMNTGVAYGGAYAITLQSQPLNLNCSVTNGTGIVGPADVNSVRIACSPVATVLYAFAGGDGANPYAGLIQGSDGNFYGTTYGGGANGDGSVFKLTPNGSETLLYSFAGGTADGANPYGGLLQGSDGTLYGTTVNGGANGYGTVFALTPGGTETLLYSFGASATDGQSPQAALILGSDGNFYGTTLNGGINGDGTVFQLTPTGTETVLYSFAGGTADGANPYAGLLQASDGNFYGTTANGGANGFGTVFKVTSGGTESLLYSFVGGNGDGAFPYASLIQGSDGNFYGTTIRGGAAGNGGVFQLTSSGSETMLYFADGTPSAGLIQASDGNLYGTTVNGGISGFGSIFELTLSGTETLLYSFAGGTDDGAYPYAGLVQGTDGSLYGTSHDGGANGDGTVFKVTLQ